MARRSIYGLDLIRFMAAAAVMTYHLGFKAWNVKDYTVHHWLGAVEPPAWTRFAAVGWLGVQIFFVISGFVIAASAEGKSPYAFLTGRVRRLVPAAWICATIALLIVVLWGEPVGRVLRPWLDVMLFYPLGPWLLGQFWTLPVEIAFYAVIFGLLSLNQFRHVGAMAAVLTAVSVIYLAALTFGGAHDTHMRVTRLFLLQHGCYFAIGIILWRASRSRPSLGDTAVLIVALLGAAMQIRLACAEEVGKYLAVPVAAPLAAFGVAVVLFWLFVRFNHRLDLSDRQARAVGMVGLLTYPLYLVHLQVGGTVMAMAYNAGLPGLWALALGCAASVFVSWLLASLIEPAGQKVVTKAAAALGAKLAGQAGDTRFPFRATSPLVLGAEPVTAESPAKS